MIMTFRIPDAILGGLWCLLLPRENLAATWRQAVTIFLAFTAGTVYVLLGMMLFRGYTTTYFFWVVGSLYLVFFVICTATNYGAAAAFSFHIAFSLPPWDRPLPTEAQVAATLWVTGAIALGLAITVLVEALYRDFDRSDPLITSLNDQLFVTQRVVESIAGRRAVPEVLQKKVLQYEMTGTGRLRTTLARQGLDPIRRAHRSALIFLVFRLIELAAELQRKFPLPTEEDAERLRKVSERLEEVRRDLLQSQVPAPCALCLAQPSAGVPILPEMERIVDLIFDVFRRGESERDFAEQRGVPSRLGLLVPDAFQNPEYLRFALAGCITASLCYVLYNALDWPGTNTSVLTCIITALTTIGTSIQKQFARLAGFTIGSLIIGIPAQIFIFPNLDTILVSPCFLLRSLL
jgi:multidrug resistance protein MdtO